MDQDKNMGECQKEPGNSEQTSFLLNPEDEGPPSGAGQEATRSLKEPQVGKVERRCTARDV